MLPMRRGHLLCPGKSQLLLLRVRCEDGVFGYTMETENVRKIKETVCLSKK